MAEVAEDLEDLYEFAPAGYLSVSPEGCIAKCNQTLLDWTGHQRHALTGSRLSAFLSVGSRIYFDTHIAPLVRMQGHVNEVALDLLAADGTKLPVLANVAEKRNVDGTLAVTRIIVLKASDRRRHERDLRAAREAAEERLLITQTHEAEVAGLLEEERSMATLREQFVAVLGHDLRNPLASILSGIAILGGANLTKRDKTVLHLMRGSIARANRLVDDVMDFARSRLGSGIVVKRSGPEPLEPIVQHVVNEMRSIAAGRAINLEMALAELVECDRARIAQLLSNLLGNAVTHGDPDQPIRVTAETRDGELVLSVANGGAAIPEAAMHNLFQPFFRGDVRPSQQGLGLGLHIAAQIAQAHGGGLAVASDDAETSFTFTMPLTPNLKG